MLLVLLLLLGRSRGEPLESCGSGRFACSDGRSVPVSVRCDWVKDCDHGEDEEDCPMCGCDAFSCGNGDCRRRVDVCDGKADCPNGRDEEGCSNRPAHLFSCGDGVVILKDAICDGVPDCPLTRADEENCTSCTRDAFLCDGVCWRTTRLCDGVPDCSGGEDERHCTTTTATVSGSWGASEIVTVIGVVLLIMNGGALALMFYIWRLRQRRCLEGSQEPVTAIYSRDSSINIQVNDPEFETAFT